MLKKKEKKLTTVRFEPTLLSFNAADSNSDLKYSSNWR